MRRVKKKLQNSKPRHRKIRDVAVYSTQSEETPNIEKNHSRSPPKSEDQDTREETIKKTRHRMQPRPSDVQSAEMHH